MINNNRSSLMDKDIPSTWDPSWDLLLQSSNELCEDIIANQRAWVQPDTKGCCWTACSMPRARDPSFPWAGAAVSTATVWFASLAFLHHDGKVLSIPAITVPLCRAPDCVSEAPWQNTPYWEKINSSFTTTIHVSNNSSEISASLYFNSSFTSLERV